MLPFIKMEGLGNDFVVLDGRQQSIPLLDWQKVSDRRQGIGCDQVILLEPSAIADVKMRIINADGSEVEACGNATRCIGWLLEKPTSTIETPAGILKAKIIGEQEERPVGRAGAMIEIDMGTPILTSRELPIEGDPHEVSIGNPHLVFFKANIDEIDLEKFGAPLEHHSAFPNGTNIEVVEVIDRQTLKMRVWERGAGLTQACGTGACAVAAAAIARGLVENSVQVQMPGGDLQISWQGGESSLLMQGTVSLSFRSELDVDNYKV